MTWPAARTAIQVALDGLTISSPDAEALTAYEYPTPGHVEHDVLPAAFPLPPARRIVRMPSNWQKTHMDVRVRVLLGIEPDIESISTRMESWIEALITAFDSEVTLGGDVDVVGEQTFTGLEFYEEHSKVWGFEMGLALQISAQKTFTA